MPQPCRARSTSIRGSPRRSIMRMTPIANGKLLGQRYRRRKAVSGWEGGVQRFAGAVPFQPRPPMGMHQFGWWQRQLEGRGVFGGGEGNGKVFLKEHL